MEINFNLGSLKIVHATLIDYLKKIQNNVSSNLILIRDEKKVATNYESIDLLKKSQGTLKIIGLIGLVNVVQLCIDSMTELKQVKFDTAKSIKVLESCENLIKNISLYLDILLDGELDQPTRFYSEYLALANLIGKDVSIKDLFTPKLDMKEEIDANLQADLRVGLNLNVKTKEDLLVTLNNSKNIINNNTLIINKILNEKKIFSSEDEKVSYNEACKEIYKELNIIQNLKISKHVYVLSGIQKLFVCVTSPIFNDEITKIVNSSLDAIKYNFLNIERTVDYWIENITELNDKTGTIKANDEVTKEILYFLINTLKLNVKLQEMPVYKDLCGYFDLDFYTNQLNDNALISTIIQKQPEVVIEIDKIFLDVKEELTLITSKQANSEDFLVQHTTKFINFNMKLNDILISVETKELAGILNALNAIFNKIKNKELKFTELLQKEVSLAVVLVEYGIDTFIKSVVKELDRTNFAAQVGLQQKRLLFAATGKIEELNKLEIPVLDEKSKKSDERKAFLKIFQELSKEFLKAESILDQFFKNPEDGLEDKEEVFKSFKSAKGIFAVMGKPELSKVVVEIIKVWESILKDGLNSVDKELLNNSIMWLSGISLVISASKDDNEVEANEIILNLIPKFNKYFKKDVEEIVIEKKYIPEPKVEKFVEVKKPEPIIIKDLVISESSEYKDVPNDPDLTEVYLMEAEEVLENMAISLKAIHANLQNQEEITNVRRYFHTLKGSGKMVGLKYLGEAGWMAEQTLNKILSGDLNLNEKIFSVIKFAENQFHNWVNELKLHNFVKVDLVLFKKEFESINPNLTTSFEIISSPVKEEAIQTVTTNKLEKEVVLVGDKEISTILYNMFLEESSKHMKAMNAFVHNVENLKGAIIPSEFMLHSHTLASIARTVNLTDCANISSKMELIANLAIEKNITLNSQEMKVLAHAVDNLDKFRSVSVQIDQNYVNSLITNLHDLQESISSRNSVEDKVVSTFDMDILVEKLSKIMLNNPVQEIIDMDVLVDKLLIKLEPKINNQSSQAPFNIDTLIESLTNSIKVTIEQSVIAIHNNLKSSLDESVEKINVFVKESIEDNKSKINQMNNEFKLAIEENAKNIIESNNNFKISLDNNVKQIEIINENLKNSVDENINKVNLDLTTMLNDNTKKIHEDLNSAMQNNLSELEMNVKKTLNDSSARINGEMNTVVVDNIQRLSSGMEQAMDENLKEAKNLMLELQEEVKGIKEVKTSGIDSNEIIGEIMQKLEVILEKQYTDMSKVLTENKYNTKEVVNELFNKIDNMEINIKSMNEEQKLNEINTKESILSVTQEIKDLTGNLQNTKSGFFKNLFGK